MTSIQPPMRTAQRNLLLRNVKKAPVDAIAQKTAMTRLYDSILPS